MCFPFFSLVPINRTLIGVYRSSSTKRVLQSSQPLRPAGTGPWSGRAADEDEEDDEEEALGAAADAASPPLFVSPIVFFSTFFLGERFPRCFSASSGERDSRTLCSLQPARGDGERDSERKSTRESENPEEAKKKKTFSQTLSLSIAFHHRRRHVPASSTLLLTRPLLFFSLSSSPTSS